MDIKGHSSWVDCHLLPNLETIFLMIAILVFFRCPIYGIHWTDIPWDILTSQLCRGDYRRTEPLYLHLPAGLPLPYSPYPLLLLPYHFLSLPSLPLSIFDSLLPLIVSIGVGSRGVLFWLADGIDLFLYIRDLLSRPHLLSRCCAILLLSCYSLELDSTDTSVTTKALVLTDHGVIRSNVMKLVIIGRMLQPPIAIIVSLE